MPKNKPEPVEITTGSGAVITITPTERGIAVEVDDRHRIVYTSVISDGVRRLRFETEAIRGKETRPLR